MFCISNDKVLIHLNEYLVFIGNNGSLGILNDSSFYSQENVVMLKWHLCFNCSSKIDKIYFYQQKYMIFNNVTSFNNKFTV